MTQTKPGCLIYCVATHLFVSGGLYYAADLASRYDVHVVLHRDQSAAISDAERAALERRGVTFHWLDSLSRIAKHRYLAAFARRLLNDIEPRFILTLNDIDVFPCYLGRFSEGRNIPMVCFQSGAFLCESGEEQRARELRHGYTVHARALRHRGWPALAAYLFVRLNMRARHLFDYWVGPLVAVGRVFRGPSSHYLRTGYECQRYGDLFLVNQPGAREFRIADGMPEKTVISVPHPLTGTAGRAIYEEIYGETKPQGDILILISYSMELSPDHAEVAADNVDRLLTYLSDRYPDRGILVKLHPTLASHREGKLAQCLDELTRSNRNVTVLPPLVNAIGLLGRASVVISNPSTSLGLARMFDDRTVICVSFDTPLERHPLPVTTGVHFFPSAKDLVGVDICTLEPPPRGSEIPRDAVIRPIDEIIDARFAAAVPADSSEFDRPVLPAGVVRPDS